MRKEWFRASTWLLWCFRITYETCMHPCLFVQKRIVQECNEADEHIRVRVGAHHAIAEGGGASGLRSSDGGGGEGTTCALNVFPAGGGGRYSLLQLWVHDPVRRRMEYSSSSRPLPSSSALADAFPTSSDTHKTRQCFNQSPKNQSKSYNMCRRYWLKTRVSRRILRRKSMHFVLEPAISKSYREEEGMRTLNRSGCLLVIVNGSTEAARTAINSCSDATSVLLPLL